MNVAFLNENMLGHSSYLPRFAAALERRPELGIHPVRVDALPLPPHLKRWGDTSIRGLRRFGLDFHALRWRSAASRNIREQLDRIRVRQPIDALVVNTQSVGLKLGELPVQIPTFVGLDATFRQLADSPWMGQNAAARFLQPITLSALRRAERRLFQTATRLLPWSGNAAKSLAADYGIDRARIHVLPPSMEVPARRSVRERPLRPRLLFVGGDFSRKGGPLLLECHRRHLADRCDLDVVTETDVPAAPGLRVHRGVTAGSEAWRHRWNTADVFVFPSRLETFGIVLLEALAFEVPIVSSNAGAAETILGSGAYGKLLPELTVEALRVAVTDVLEAPAAAAERARLGRQSFEEKYNLQTNTALLAKWLREAVTG